MSSQKDWKEFWIWIEKDKKLTEENWRLSMGKIGWENAKKEMEKLEKRRLEQMKEEVARRLHYIEHGEWVYKIKQDIRDMKK